MKTSFVFACAAFTAVVTCCTLPGSRSGGEKLNGLHKYYYPDGKLYLEVNYRDSIAHGVSRQYFKNGKVFDETNYVNGTIHGVSKRYYEDGTLSSETPYDSGRIHGIKKKYRRDGKLAYEAPYYYDHPCTGLKEYYLSGNPVSDYPTIVVNTEDRTLKSDLYIVEFSLSDKRQRVEFYKGNLTDGKYIGDNLYPLNTVNGVARLHYVLPPGAFVMEKMNIIAKVRTDLNNYYITERSYNLAAENR